MECGRFLGGVNAGLYEQDRKGFDYRELAVFNQRSYEFSMYPYFTKGTRSNVYSSSRI